MAKEPTLRDLPSILRLAKRKYREGNSNYLDRLSLSILKKYGLPITKRNASLYNLGGSTAAACILLPVILFYSCSPQEFVRQPYYWRLVESAAPVLLPGVMLMVGRSLPAFALSLRYNALTGLTLYLPLCLIYNLA